MDDRSGDRRTRGSSLRPRPPDPSTATGVGHFRPPFVGNIHPPLTTPELGSFQPLWFSDQRSHQQITPGSRLRTAERGAPSQLASAVSEGGFASAANGRMLPSEHC